MLSVPKYKKVGVLLIDKHLHPELKTVGNVSYVDIEAIGMSSNINIIFRVNIIGK